MIRYRLGMPLCGIAVLIAFSSGNAYAQGQTATPVVVCFASPAKISDEEVKDFMDNPAGLLPSFQTGGLPLSTRVRSLAGSSSATLEPILGLVPSANPAQIAAIGAGLARTARACAASNPDYAAMIQQKVAELNNESLILAFASGLNDVQTAALGGATGGATGGGAGGIGGDGSAGGGVAGVGGDFGTATTSGTFTVTGSSRFFSSNEGGGSSAETGSPN